MFRKQQGVSLIELMVVGGIVGITLTIAIPLYTDYVDTSRRGAMLQNMEQIRLFEEEARLSNGSYQAGTYDPADPANVAGTTGLSDSIGWSPGTSSDEIKYVVSAVTSTTFTITATHVATNTVERKNYTKP